MGHSPLLGPEPAPEEPAGRENAVLGPSDRSDSGSDSVGLPGNDDNSDAAGTGERSGAGAAGAGLEPGDIGVDRVFTPGRRRHMKADAGERLHDDEDGDLAFIDTAEAPDPLDDEPDPAEGMMDEGDNIPGGSEQPRTPPPDRPEPEPEERTAKPAPGDQGAQPPADEKDQREKQPGRARLLMRKLVSRVA